MIASPRDYSLGDRMSQYEQIMDAITAHQVGNRPGRIKPRLRKRRFKKYDYMAKPLRPLEVKNLLKKWIQYDVVLKGESKLARSGGGEASGAAAKMEPTLSKGQVIDPDIVYELFGTEPDEVHEMLGMFSTTLEKHVEEIQAAVERHADAESVRICAHKIKGSAASFGAERLQAVASAFEMSCKAKDLTEGPVYVSRIRDEFECLKSEMESRRW